LSRLFLSRVSHVRSVCSSRRYCTAQSGREASPLAVIALQHEFPPPYLLPFPFPITFPSFFFSVGHASRSDFLPNVLFLCRGHFFHGKAVPSFLFSPLATDLALALRSVGTRFCRAVKVPVPPVLPQSKSAASRLLGLQGVCFQGTFAPIESSLEPRNLCTASACIQPFPLVFSRANCRKVSDRCITFR